MIFKFPYTIKILNQLLNSFSGFFNALYIPNYKLGQFCYASLTHVQTKPFLQHFGENGGCILSENSTEYPGNIINLNNKLTKTFELHVRL
ncbi:MAG: hypothetical protein ABIO55_13130 [Ginsengibacter sp.]